MTILVTGVTGTVGRRVVEHLLERGEHVRAVTRDPARAEFPAGVDVVRGDLADPASLESALEGVTGLHLITFDGGLFAPLTSGEELMERARAAGVRRVTVLNGGGDTPMETAVRGSGLAWTVVMPVEFMANALEWAPDIKAEGVVREPFVDRLSAMVHESDIASVAATALTDEGHGGQVYLITGPQALTVRDKVAAIAAARGQEIGLVELTEEEALTGWRAKGMPEDVIAFLIEVYRDTPPEGRTVIDTVEKVTGRPARTFAQWAGEHAEFFRA